MLDNIKNISEEILSKVDIVKEIGKYIKLSARSGSYVGLCPFHNDSSASFSVSPKYGKHGIWKCFSGPNCGSGNVIDFVAKFKKISKLEAIRLLAKEYNIDVSEINNNDYHYNQSTKRIYEVLKITSNLLQDFLYSKKGKEYLDYLHNRGLTDEVIKKFNLGFGGNDNIAIDFLTNKDNKFPNTNQNNILNTAELSMSGLVIDDGKNGIFLLNNRVTFPIFDKDNFIVAISGRIIKKNSGSNIKYLNMGNTPVFNKSDFFYNENLAFNSNDDKLYMCEGYMDAIAFYRAGISNCVATMGVNLSEEQIKKIKKYNFKSIILCFDSDMAGVTATNLYAEKLVKEGFKVYIVNSLPHNCKDVDELITTHGKEETLKAINNVDDYVLFYIKNNLLPEMSLVDRVKVIQNIEFLISKCGISQLYDDYDNLVFELSRKHLSFPKEKTPLVTKKIFVPTPKHANFGKIRLLVAKILRHILVKDTKSINNYTKIPFLGFKDILPVEGKIMQCIFTIYWKTGNISLEHLYDFLSLKNEKSCINYLNTQIKPYEGNKMISNGETLESLFKEVEMYYK